MGFNGPDRSSVPLARDAICCAGVRSAVEVTCHNLGAAQTDSEIVSPTIETVGGLLRSCMNCVEIALMKRTSVGFARGFRVLLSDDYAQAASMVIEPGGKEGGADNRHRGADQWLYVTEGTGKAIINGHGYELDPGSLVTRSAIRAAVR